MTAKIKQMIRRMLGDAAATSIHAIRFAYLIKTNRLPQEKDMEIIGKLSLKGKVVVDVGANSANWTNILSDEVGESGSVFAFEADPYYAAATHKAIILLGLKNVIFFPIGASDKEETLPLVVIDENGERVSGTGKIVDDKTISVTRTVEVKLRALDAIAESYPDLFNTALIKCDVEGFEYRVFKGAQRIIETSRPIVISEIDANSKETRNVFNFFKSLDYKSYVVVTESSIRSSESAGGIPEGERPNRIFIPQEYLIPAAIHVIG